VTGPSVNGVRMVPNVPGRGLNELAEQTGGSHLAARRIANVATMFTRIRQELQGHYLLGFVPALADGRAHKLAVQSTRPGVTVRSRRAYATIQPASR